MIPLLQLTYAIMAVTGFNLICSIYNGEWSTLCANLTALLGWYQVMLFQKEERAPKKDPADRPYDPMTSPTDI